MNTTNVLEKSLFSKLPFELVEFIWTLNYNWAANIIQTKSRKFMRKKISNIYDMLSFVRRDCKFDLALNKYSLFYRNKILKREQVFSLMTSCQCCKRHQIRKPKTIVKKEREDYFNWTQDTDCSCPCRHVSRFICREVDDE